MVDEYVHGFVLLSEAWYGPANRTKDVSEDICFGLYHREGGCRWEAGIQWGEPTRTAHVRIYADAFAALTSAPVVAFLQALAESHDPSPVEVRAMLLRCGFEDLTPRKRPGTVSVLQEDRLLSVTQVTVEQCIAARDLAAAGRSRGAAAILADVVRQLTSRSQP